MSDHTDAARTAEAVLDIEGMTCASCVARVEKKLRRVDGVDAAVNLATETARVRYPSDLDTTRLVDAVRAAGYDARVRTRGVATTSRSGSGAGEVSVASVPGAPVGSHDAGRDA
ncbi:MAG: heavy-metal-associated domain-containing protein, partial [Actinobacteria bacterium]|nr:heavy-metal-associated domain-containing protein [Actinomycetota bacterium]